MELMITIVKVMGRCPVYQQGDSIVLKEGYILDVERSCSPCLHSLASVFPYYNALRHGVAPTDLGLAPDDGRPARIQCLDPCEYTGGGTVIMEIRRIPKG
jgi:uncharacterized repeat protein (TIGR04076 family)